MITITFQSKWWKKQLPKKVKCNARQNVKDFSMVIVLKWLLVVAAVKRVIRVHLAKKIRGYMWIFVMQI